MNQARPFGYDGRGGGHGPLGPRQCKGQCRMSPSLQISCSDAYVSVAVHVGTAFLCRAALCFVVLLLFKIHGSKSLSPHFIYPILCVIDQHFNYHHFVFIVLLSSFLFASVHVCAVIILCVILIFCALCVCVQCLSGKNQVMTSPWCPRVDNKYFLPPALL